MTERRYTSLQNIFDILDVKNGTYGLVYICTLRGARAGYAFGEKFDTPLFAVKTLQDKYLGKEDLVKKFYREAETWVKLGSNENIVRADCVLEIDQLPHIFMEYVEGGNLRNYLRKGYKDLRQALDFAIQFCDGMIYVNNKDIGNGEKGIVHRDVKPENIMLTKDWMLKITDFGLVKALDEVVVGFAGTMEYASPEQFSGGRIDSRCDIYSFGIVLYEMLTGERPFTGPDFEQYAYQHRWLKPTLPTKLNSEIPKELERIILRCLEKNPEDRYQVFEDLRTELIEAYRRSFGRRPEKKVVEGPPPAIDRSTLTGVSLSSLGKMREALLWLDEAVKKNPRNVLAWHYKGEALDRLGKHADAIECFDQVLRINPEHIATWSAKADALGNLGRYEEAIECYDKANELKPMLANHEFWANKGLALFGLRKYKEAEECFDKAIEIFLGSTRAWMGKALILEESGRLHEAVKCYEKVVEFNPRDSAAWREKGNLLCRLDRFKEAIPCFEKALEIKPEDAKTWTSLGGALASMNRFEEAIRCCDKAVEIDPRYELAKRLREFLQDKI